jgi:hypothetical protein
MIDMELVGQCKLGDKPERITNMFVTKKNRLFCTIEWQTRADGTQPMNSFEDFEYMHANYWQVLLDYYRLIVRPI